MVEIKGSVKKSVGTPTLAAKHEKWDRRCILVTGCCGFIGAKTTELLLQRGHVVVGVDSLNDYYDVRLKKYRLGLLKDHEGFLFHRADIELIEQIESLLGKKAAISFLPKQVLDMDATWAHIGRAKDLLGWEPKVPLEEGLKRTVAWYLDNREWARSIEIDLAV